MNHHHKGNLANPPDMGIIVVMGIWLIKGQVKGATAVEETGEVHRLRTDVRIPKRVIAEIYW